MSLGKGDSIFFLFSEKLAGVEDATVEYLEGLAYSCTVQSPLTV